MGLGQHSVPGRCVVKHTSQLTLVQSLGKSPAYIKCNHGVVPPDCKDKHVAVFDFSWPRATLRKMQDEAASFVLFDHHKYVWGPPKVRIHWLGQRCSRVGWNPIATLTWRKVALCWPGTFSSQGNRCHKYVTGSPFGKRVNPKAGLDKVPNTHWRALRVAQETLFEEKKRVVTQKREP